MARFSHKLAAFGLRLIGKVAQHLSIRGRIVLGRTISRLMMIGRNRVEITRDNVRRAFPGITAIELESIVRTSYENLGIVLVETLALPALTRDELINYVHFTGLGRVKDILGEGTPVVFVSGHFGNWEYIAMSGALQMDCPYTIVAHPQSNAIVDELLNTYRSRFGNVIVPMGNAARALVNTIRRGGTLAFLVDQHANPVADPWIEFFGRATPTYQAPAALALKYDIPLVTGFAVRQADGRYEVELKMIPHDDLSDTPDDIVELTRRHVQELERVIRTDPGLWSWQHRRWRT